jgi:hypothetical protein
MQEIPEMYIIDGVKTLKHARLNDVTEAVDFETPKGTKFFLARDMVGIQFCTGGKIWPSLKSFPSMENAMEYFRDNLEDAIAFFDSNIPSKQFSLNEIFFAAAVAGQRKAGVFSKPAERRRKERRRNV